MTEEARPVLDQINVVVGDMEAMVAFYRGLGVEIRDTATVWDRHHREATMPAGSSGSGGIEFELDSAEFAPMWNEGWPQGSTGVVIGFRVGSREAVDEIYESLVGAGHRGQQAPHDAFWGARYAVVEDPDGNSVGLMSPADPSMRSAPPAPPG